MYTLDSRPTPPPGAAPETPRALQLAPVRESQGSEPLLVGVGEVVLGRGADAHIRLAQEGLADQHCAIRFDGRQAIVRALSPLTWLNDGPVRESRLRPGDVLTLGPLDFRVGMVDLPVPPPPPVAPSNVGTALSPPRSRSAVGDGDPLSASPAARTGDVRPLLAEAHAARALTEELQRLERELEWHRSRVSRPWPDVSGRAARGAVETLPAGRSVRDADIDRREQELATQLDILTQREAALLARESELEHQDRQVAQERQQAAAVWERMTAQQRRLTVELDRLRSEREELQTQQQSLAAERADFDAAVEALDADRAALRAERLESQRRLASERHKLEERQRELDQAAEAAARLKLELDGRADRMASQEQAVAAQLSEAEARTRAVREQSEQLRQQQDDLRLQQTRLNQQREELQQQRAELSRQQAELRTQHEQLSGQQASLSEAMQALRAREQTLHEHEIAMRETEQALCEQTHALREQEATLREELRISRDKELALRAEERQQSERAQELARQAASLDQQRHDLDVAREELAARQQACREQETRTSEREAELQAREQAAAARERRLSEAAAGLASDRAAFEAECSEWSQSVQRDRDSLMQQRDAHAADVRELEQRQAVLDALAAQLEQRSQELEQREAACADGSTAGDASEQHVFASDGSTSPADAQELVVLREALTEERQRLAAWAVELEGLVADLERREQQLAAGLARLEADRAAAQHDRVTLASQSAAAVAAAEEQRRAVESLSAQELFLSRREGELNAREAELTAREQAVAERAAAIDRESAIRAAVADETTSAHEAASRARIEDLQAEVERLELDRANLVQELSDLQRLQAELRDERTWLQAESERCALEHARLQALAADLARRQEELQARSETVPQSAGSGPVESTYVHAHDPHRDGNDAGWMGTAQPAVTPPAEHDAYSGPSAALPLTTGCREESLRHAGAATWSDHADHAAASPTDVEREGSDAAVDDRPSAMCRDWARADSGSDEADEPSSDLQEASTQAEPRPAEDHGILALREQMANLFGISLDELSTAARRQTDPEDTRTAPAATPAAEECPSPETSYVSRDVAAYGQCQSREMVEAASEPVVTRQRPAGEGVDDGSPMEDSVAAYMERLLASAAQRDASVARDGANSLPTNSSDVWPPAMSASASHAGTAGTAEVTTLRTNEPRAETASSTRPARRMDPSDFASLRANLDSMRQIANQSARSAVALHTSKKLSLETQVKIALTAVCGTVAVGLFSANMWSRHDYGTPALGALMVTFVSGLELVRTLLRLRRVQHVAMSAEPGIDSSGELDSASGLTARSR